MGLFGKKHRSHNIPRDPETQRALEQAKEEYEEVLEGSEEVFKLTQFLAERRQRNHFGDDLTISFTPRRRHA